MQPRGRQPAPADPPPVSVSTSGHCGYEGLDQGQYCELSGLEPTWFPSWMESEKARHVQEVVGQ